MSTEPEQVAELTSDALKFLIGNGIAKTDAHILMVAAALGEVATQAFALGAEMGKETAMQTMRNHPAGRH